MFNPTQDDRERLKVWRNFRHTFNRQTGTEADVVKAFEDVPNKIRYIDYYTPEDWPSVFEIVQDGFFCQSGLTLVVASTLHYLGFIKSEVLEFDVVSNHITGTEGLVLVHEGKAYNFIPGAIVSVEYMHENGTVYDRHQMYTDNFYH